MEELPEGSLPVIEAKEKPPEAEEPKALEQKKARRNHLAHILSFILIWLFVCGLCWLHGYQYGRKDKITLLPSIVAGESAETNIKSAIVSEKDVVALLEKLSAYRKELEPKKEFLESERLKKTIAYNAFVQRGQGESDQCKSLAVSIQKFNEAIQPIAEGLKNVITKDSQLRVVLDEIQTDEVVATPQNQKFFSAVESLLADRKAIKDSDEMVRSGGLIPFEKLASVSPPAPANN